MTTKILYDLSMGLDTLGFSGIPQDARLLFDTLAQSSRVDVSGLVRPAGRSRYNRRPLSDLLEQAEFLGPFLSGQMDTRDLPAKVLDRVGLRRASRAWQLYAHPVPLDPGVYPIDPAFADLIWRKIFAMTVEPSHRARTMSKSFYATKLGGERNAAAGLGLLPAPRLNTEGFDFIVSQDTRVMRAHPMTRKVVRYHDGLPVTASDTFSAVFSTKLHFKAIHKSTHDTLFVCNSTSAKNDLSTISPEVGEKSVVIPYVIPKMTPASPNANVLRYIAQNRISPRTINESQRIRSISEWMGGGENHIPRYIMSLATIEPRKNYGRLIEAWQVVRAQGHDDVRLMIVGSPGWLYAGTLKAMRPYIERGELLHLEKVAQSELPMLYSCASVFCFPSMAEGFGLPPTEAMQCSCPVVLSDIPAHRYMAGESALMCDPYSVADIAEKLTVALTDDEVRKSLKHKGLENVKRFTVDEVLPKWEDFFEKNRLPQASR